MLCRKLNLFADAFVAIDGSKFKAVNNRDRNFTKAKMKRRCSRSMRASSGIWDRSVSWRLEAAEEGDGAPKKARSGCLKLTNKSH